ncbi:MAG: hypothetical protein KGH60_01660 [Candidatus Micrarchaeota archaeon]|nr:hypothetical protein [Candidatus Micrarchaeota archaeon]
MTTKQEQTEEVIFSKTEGGVLISNRKLTPEEADTEAKKYPNHRIANTTQIDVLDRTNKAIHSKLDESWILTSEKGLKETRLFIRKANGEREYLHEGHLYDLPEKKQEALWQKLYEYPISERGTEWKGGGSVFAGCYNRDGWLSFNADWRPGGRGWVVLVPEEANQNKQNGEPQQHSSIISDAASILRVGEGQTKTIIIADATGKKMAELKIVGEATAHIE